MSLPSTIYRTFFTRLALRLWHTSNIIPVHFLIEVLVFSLEIPLCASEKGNNFHIYG